MTRGRFREALDVLNEAIRIDPRFAESYDVRAAAFERMGMYPQADADRRKVAALGGVQRPAAPPTPPPAQPRAPLADRPQSTAPTPPTMADVPEAEPSAAQEQPQPTGQRRVAVPRYPAPRRPGSGGNALARTGGTALIAIGLLAAAGIGIYLALSAISGVFNDDDTGGGPGAVEGSETPAASDGASPTEAPVPGDGLAGDPLSFTRFEAGWAAVGIEAVPGATATTLSGFAETPVTVTLSRDGEEMLVAMMLYDGRDATGIDWTLGEQAVPKEGRVIPDGVIVWYNANAVVVILEGNQAIHAEARDAFFGVSP